MFVEENEAKRKAKEVENNTKLDVSS